MRNFPIPRIDKNPELHEHLRMYSRLQSGDIWQDPSGIHRIGCLDASDNHAVNQLMDGNKATLALHDPPYNLIAFEEQELESFIAWCKLWVDNTYASLKNDAAFYVWLGADQRNNYQPFPDFMIMMRDTDFVSRSFITMRNQRGYGTQLNWMAVRQELLYYVKGNPVFNVEAEYTEIPKILRGYYKEINGQRTENFERSKSDNIRAGNVWVDIQQVFYRMEENVNGCYAQKPLKSAERIIRASSSEGDVVIDFFCHSASTLIACEMLGRRCFTTDIDPVYCEIAIRRIENWRKTGRTGWQNSNPFEKEMMSDTALKTLMNLGDEESDVLHNQLVLM